MSWLVKRDFDAQDGEAISELYYAAFRAKYEPLLGTDAEARQILAKDFESSMALVVYDEHRPIGVLGFQHTGARFVDLTRTTFSEVLGRFKGPIYHTILSFFDRKSVPGELLLDGIAVSSEYRGKGVGSALLNAAKCLTKTEGFERMRLDVVDTNPRAKSLYERHGFVAEEVEDLSAWSELLGFSKVTTMRFYPEVTDGTK